VCNAAPTSCIKVVISIGYPVTPTKLQQSGRTE
jgi:hypothetical protein